MGTGLVDYPRVKHLDHKQQVLQQPWQYFRTNGTQSRILKKMSQCNNKKHFLRFLSYEEAKDHTPFCVLPYVVKMADTCGKDYGCKQKWIPLSSNNVRR